MAKKRLNKKVALIGSMVFVLLGMAAIFVFLRFGGDPQKFIEDGDAAWKAAKEAIDDEVRTEQYEKAAASYHKARTRAKTDSLRVKVLLKLVDIYLETGEWKFVRGCWYNVIQLDPKNVKARFGQLKYFYIVADNYANSGVDALGPWKAVQSQASEFIEVADASLLTEDTAKWDSFAEIQEGVDAKRVGPYLYLLRGRATFEIARIGAVSDPEESFTRAVEDLGKVIELEPGNVEAYWYLARTVLARAKFFALRGAVGERKKSAEQAEKILEKAVEVADDDPAAHINLLIMKPAFARISGVTTTKEQIESLEPEYLSLVERFDSSAQAYLALAKFYHSLGHEKLDKAVDAIERAVELDRENVAYAIDAANLYHQKFSVFSAWNQGRAEDIHRAIELARGALTLPNTKETKGPRRWANERNRIWLYDFLVKCYVGQVLEPDKEQTESERQKWLTDAEGAVYEIEQIYGSGEEPHVVRCRGMLELAKGNKDEAVRKLYEAYEQLKATGAREDPQLSYTLAKIFKNTSEVGAVMEFLASAIGSGIERTKPEAHLDYAETLLKFSYGRSMMAAVSYINAFEKNFGPNERSQTLRIKAYTRIRAMKFLETDKGRAKFRLNKAEKELARTGFEKAEEELARIAQPNDPNTIRLKVALVRAKIGKVLKNIRLRQVEETPGVLTGLEEEGDREQATEESMRAEVRNYRNVLAELVERLLATEPNSFREVYIAPVCSFYIAEGRIEKAKSLVNRYLEYFPDNTTALFHKQVLSEPEKDMISTQRRKEIEEQVLSGIADPVVRAMNLGMFHRRYNEPNEAAAEFKKVLGARLGAADYVTSVKLGDKEVADLQNLAADYLFSIAIRTKNWELAEQITEMVRLDNLDGCEGQFFAARLAVAKEEHKDALVRLDECLRRRPVFSSCFRLRGRVNAALGNEHASIEDIKKAAALNPLDKTTAARLAIKLYERNRKLADNVTADQRIETRNALEAAVALNPADNQLLSLYAEYISSTEPSRALAIRQYLQQRIPNTQNAVLLASLATDMATGETDTDKKEALFEIAGSALEQALRLNPQDAFVLSAYAQYYRIKGQEGKARELLEKAGQKQLLWRHFYHQGKFADAKAVLEQLYRKDPADSNSVRGLLLVSKETGNRDGVKKYSEKLLSLEENVEYYLLQIQTFLEIGLVKEAEIKLQSFMERFPDEPRSRLLQAWLVMRQGRLKDSLAAINRYLERNQNNAKAWELRGKVNFLRGDYSQAITDYRKSGTLVNNPEISISLARTYLRAGRGQEAITELQKVIEYPMISMWATRLLEQTYRQLGRKRALERLYDSTLEAMPENVFWHLRAAGYAQQENDFAEAIRLYEKSWQISRKNGEGNAAALDGYLGTLILDGKLEKVFEEGSRYIDSDFAHIAFFRMAEAKLQLGDKTTAVEYCRKAIDISGASEILASGIVEKVASLLGTQEVLKYSRQRLETNSLSETANLVMFYLSKLGKEYNKAIDYIDKCLQITGSGSPQSTAYAIEKVRVLQLAYDKTSDNRYLNKAIEEYESLLEKMPNNTSILNNMAFLLAESGQRLSKALEYARRAYEMKPNSPNILDTYSYVLYKNGKLAEAAELLQAAMQHFEDSQITISPEVYEHLGMIKEELSSPQEALDAYKQALQTAELSEKSVERIKSAVERLSREIADN